MKPFLLVLSLVLFSAGEPRAEGERDPLLDVRPNAYGLGVNSDQYGRPHRYETGEGRPTDPIQQEGVKRDAYGLGVHADEFGRPVYDGKPGE